MVEQPMAPFDGDYESNAYRDAERETSDEGRKIVAVNGAITLGEEFSLEA